MVEEDDDFGRGDKHILKASRGCRADPIVYSDRFTWVRGLRAPDSKIR